MATHQGAAALLGEKNMAVFRGEGGEIECRPNKPFEVRSIRDGVLTSEAWPPMLPESRQPIDEGMAVERLLAVWRGEAEDGYAVAAVTGTLAIALKALGQSDDIAGARGAARAMWDARAKGRLAPTEASIGGRR